MSFDDPTELIDSVIDERYQLVHFIGAGPHANAFVAFDQLEGRDVAVKVFHPTFGEDSDLTQRMFRQFEQAAALDHPNLLPMLGWGADGTALWLATELCVGGSLRSMIDSRRLLTVSQALVMTLACARALEHGHRQEIVHRSIRPENILFDAQGRVRISDFGLGYVTAQAIASRSSWSVDLVRYASPEQARGRVVDRRSDVYSLALAVNEAVTGLAPPATDTAVGTMMARAEASLEVGQELGQMRSPIERCGRVDADLRPDVDELAIALLAAAETLPAPMPFPIVGVEGYVPTEPAELIEPDPVDESARFESARFDAPAGDALDFGDDADLDGDEAGPPKTADVPIVSIDGTEHYDDDDDAGGPVLVPVPDLPDRTLLDDLNTVEPVFAARVDDGETALDVPTAPPSRSSVAYREQDDDLDELLPKWPLIALVLVAVAGVALVATLILAGGTRSPSVPEVVGTDVADLASVLGESEWEIEVRETRLNGSTAGTIVAQDPVAGETLDDHDTLAITVSLGNEMVEIPSDLSGLTLEQAQTRLAGARLNMGAVTEENSETLESGLVISVDEPTRQKPEGETVSLRVSLGPTARVVPASVVGASVGDATAQLAGLRLQAVEEQIYDPLAEPGTVLSVVPGPGEAIPADSQVTLVVSAGPEPVVMPDIEGFALADAYDALEALGLVVLDAEGPPGEPVVSTVPPIGELVDVGSEVIIVLAEPDEDDEDDEG